MPLKFNEMKKYLEIDKQHCLNCEINERIQFLIDRFFLVGIAFP